MLLLLLAVLPDLRAVVAPCAFAREYALSSSWRQARSRLLSLELNFLSLALSLFSLEFRSVKLELELELGC